MIKKKKLKDGRVCLEQHTYFIYNSEEDWEEGKVFLTTSDKKIFKIHMKNKKNIAII